MSDQHNLPEGVINANPPGGFESGDVADGETREQNQDAAGSPALSESGLSAGGGDEPSDPIESPDASQGADPDLAADEEI
ncbi:hypothetical protein ACFXP7_02995 [Microbacterium sp. P06]|uniref:hypothetical protein n=1 Tax=Microbacterium sp. P06 TaxID=3366949 RepID=UPI0037451160